MGKIISLKHCSSLLAIILLPIMFACSQTELEQDSIAPATNAKDDATLASSLSHSIPMDSVKSIAMSIPNIFNKEQTKSSEKAIKEILPYHAGRNT